MPFKIIITETREVRKILPKTWEKLGEKEVARDVTYIDSSSPERTRMTDYMGYTPEVETVQTETVERLSQVVEELDLAKVIRAINNLP